MCPLTYYSTRNNGETGKDPGKNPECSAPAEQEEFLLDEEGLPPEDCRFFEDFDSLDEEEDAEEVEDAPGKSPMLIRIVALITALAFMGLVVLASWPALKLPINDLVAKSFQLKKNTDPRLLEAVVKIDVLAGRNGSPLDVEQRSGTGFNISPRGLIVTNHHVIEGARKIAVRFPDGTLYNAQRWVSRKEYDLALISLNGSGLPAVFPDDSGGPAPGDKIRVVGNPLGLNNIVAEGRVGQYVRLEEGDDPVFTIDAPIYPGNSGSPVYNGRGQVVGVVFAAYAPRGAGDAGRVGLAVPVKQLIDIQ